ncbi:MAG TPA: 2-succinyl-5-enolpyruvyl-6-hydroxy-3-cyclohexene-1-carboxylic-acid synthase [Mycobacteriales bacterium]|nr:2-succinyl-5-enolpyruvyl-6-hydroxy-3-cyclohexene-1-carboxylic-acid synthase [Mycobacteriales bacterium]
MNPSTALARVLVDELVRNGVREAVLSPGSRSAPLAFALHAADAAGRLRLHVRIDERSAGFLALGLAKASGIPAAVVTTSGTAVANLHPAVLEAAHAGVPLLVLTADRPPELRGVGANQTVDQPGIFGTAVRLFTELGAPESRAGQNAYWRSAVCRAVAAAATGPVHVNLALREPLVPSPDDDWPEPLAGRAGPWTEVLPPAAPAPVADDLPARTVLVLGDAPAAVSAAAVALAETRGWPVVAEPSARLAAGPNVLAGGDLLLRGGFVAAHRPDRVLAVGRPTLSRAVGRLLAAAPLDVVSPGSTWTDPSGRAARVLPAVPTALVAGSGALAPAGDRDESWLPAWRDAADAARKAVDALLGDALSEPGVAAELMDAVPPGGLVVCGSSKPVRDLFLAGPRAGVTVLANRGAAGIDGTVSTAVGAALAHGPAYALLGDLTFLHDANGLVIGPDEPRPDLTVVVVNNDGGAIFGVLEQGAPEYAEAFERVFGTPHGVDLAALCAATGTPYQRVTSRTELRGALAEPQGIRVIEVRTDRHAAAELDAAITAVAG